MMNRCAPQVPSSIPHHPAHHQNGRNDHLRLRCVPDSNDRRPLTLSSSPPLLFFFSNIHLFLSPPILISVALTIAIMVKSTRIQSLQLFRTPKFLFCLPLTTPSTLPSSDLLFRYSDIGSSFLLFSYFFMFFSAILKRCSFCYTDIF